MFRIIRSEPRALAVRGTEPKTSSMLGKHFISDLHPQPSILKSVNDPIMSLSVVKLLCASTAPACCSPPDNGSLPPIYSEFANPVFIRIGPSWGWKAIHVVKIFMA